MPKFYTINLWRNAETLINKDITIIEKVLYLNYAENTGVAFSMFADNRWILVGVTSLMLIAVLAFFLSGKMTGKLEVFSLSLLLAGGVGNLIDRISLGYVIDYIEVLFVDFYIFNFADCLVTCAAIVMICNQIYEIYKENKAKKEKAADD